MYVCIVCVCVSMHTPCRKEWSILGECVVCVWVCVLKREKEYVGYDVCVLEREE